MWVTASWSVLRALTKQTDSLYRASWVKEATEREWIWAHVRNKSASKPSSVGEDILGKFFRIKQFLWQAPSAVSGRNVYTSLLRHGRGDNVPTTPFPELSPPRLQKSRGDHRKPAHRTASPTQIKNVQGNVVGSAVYTVGDTLWPSCAFWEGNDNLISGNQLMLFIRNKKRKIDRFSRFRKCVSGMVVHARNPSKHWKGREHWEEAANFGATK